MKKILFIIGLAISTVSFGQKKGDKFISGTVSYTKSTDVKGIYNITPTIGYHVTDKVSVGVFGDLGKNSTTSTTNVGVFGRCDFMSIGQHCKVFSQLGVASNSSKDNTTSVKSNSFSTNLGMGANYEISSNWALTMNLIDLITYESADGKSTTTIGFGGVNSPFTNAKFGLLYRF